MCSSIFRSTVCADARIAVAHQVRSSVVARALNARDSRRVHGKKRGCAHGHNPVSDGGIGGTNQVRRLKFDCLRTPPHAGEHRALRLLRHKQTRSMNTTHCACETCKVIRSRGGATRGIDLRVNTALRKGRTTLRANARPARPESTSAQSCVSQRESEADNASAWHAPRVRRSRALSETQDAHLQLWPHARPCACRTPHHTGDTQRRHGDRHVSVVQRAAARAGRRGESRRERAPLCRSRHMASPCLARR